MTGACCAHAATLDASAVAPIRRKCGACFTICSRRTRVRKLPAHQRLRMLTQCIAMRVVSNAARRSGDAVEDVAGFGERFEEGGDVFGATGFHGEVYGGVAEIYAVVGAIVGGGHDVGAMLGEHAGETM